MAQRLFPVPGEVIHCLPVEVPPEFYREFDYHCGHQLPAGFAPVHHLKESNLLHAISARSQCAFCV